MDGQPLPPIGLAGPTGLDPLTLNHTLVHEWTIMKGSLQEIAMAIQECKCLVVSDGSFKEGHCTAAFTLRCLSTGAQILGVNALPGPIEMSDSFRGELGGTVGALEMIRWISATHGISSGSLTLASDGEGAIKKASSTSRLHHSQASFDLLQKIREQLRKLPINIDWKWVKGHQSGKLSLVARLNKLCDETAKAYWRHMDAQQTWKSSASFLESWQVWLGDDKLTSISLEAVYDWSILFDQDFSPQTYWQAKHQIPPEDFHNVDWEATGRANKSQSSSQQRWLAKFLSGFLGTNQREHFRQASTDPSCPRCDCPCEDARHVVLCQGEGAVDVWRAGLNKLDERLSNMDTMPELQLVMMSRLRSWYAGTTPRQFSISNKHLMQALEGQDRIGWNNFVYGRPHYLWSISQLAFYQSTGSTKSPRRWLQAILKQLWAISWDMWQHRNHVKHKQISHAPSPVLSSLRSQLYRLSLGANEDWLESEQLILRFSDKDVLNWTETELRARIASILAIRRRVKNRVQVALNLARPMRQFMQNWFKFGSGNASH